MGPLLPASQPFHSLLALLSEGLKLKTVHFTTWKPVERKGWRGAGRSGAQMMTQVISSFQLFIYNASGNDEDVQGK